MCIENIVCYGQLSLQYHHNTINAMIKPHPIIPTSLPVIPLSALCSKCCLLAMLNNMPMTTTIMQQFIL